MVHRTFLNFDADGQKGEYSCGPRCASIGGVATNWYEGTPTNSTESQWNVTECDVKISNVQGAHEEYYQLSNAVAQLAAGAIAMDGIAQTQGTYQLYRYNNR
jgi:hypothetical protein